MDSVSRTRVWIRRLIRGAAGATLGLVAVGSPARADHIPSAQEALGSTWWGIMVLAGMAVAYMSGMVYVVWRIIQAEESREGGPGLGG